MDLADDINFILYQKLIKDEDWYNINKGKYIAIANGIIIGIDKNRDNLLAKILSEYPNKSRYFTKIERELEIIDIPTPLEIKDA